MVSVFSYNLYSVSSVMAFFFLFNTAILLCILKLTLNSNSYPLLLTLYHSSSRCFLCLLRSAHFSKSLWPFDQTSLLYFEITLIDREIG